MISTFRKSSLANIRSNHYNGVLEIKSWHTVARVEEELKEIFGLHAQIFRKEADGAWVQTTSSDHYTLADQSNLFFEELRSKI